MFDSRGEPLEQHAFRRELDPEGLEILQAEVRERARRREARAFMPSLGEGNQALALPVAADGTPRAGGTIPPDPRVRDAPPRRGWWRSRTPARCRTSTA